jgi:DNA-binding protein HU-beta
MFRESARDCVCGTHISSILSPRLLKEARSALPLAGNARLPRPLSQLSKEYPLNSTELADGLAETHDISKAKAKEIVTSIFASIIEAAKKGDEVAITGFGRFSVKERPAREGRNPRTGEALKIPASKSLGFKMSKPVGAAL